MKITMLYQVSHYYHTTRHSARCFDTLRSGIVIMSNCLILIQYLNLMFWIVCLQIKFDISQKI